MPISDKADKPVVAPQLPVRQKQPQPSSSAQAYYRLILIVFLLCFGAAWAVTLLGVDLSEHWRWAGGVLVALAALASAMSLTSRLPLPNVLWSAALIGTLAFIIETLQATTQFPFGPRRFDAANLGSLAFDRLPWPVPVGWIAIILTSRGVARLVMRPYRRMRHYGYWVIVASGLLAVGLDLGLEPFAVGQYWTWETASATATWFGAPWSNFVSWFAVTVLILAFTTPWLIGKHASRQPLTYDPLILWSVINLFFASVNALKGVWLAAGVGLGVNAVVAYLCISAVRGAAAPPPPAAPGESQPPQPLPSGQEG